MCIYMHIRIHMHAAREREREGERERDSCVCVCVCVYIYIYTYISMYTDRYDYDQSIDATMTRICTSFPQNPKPSLREYLWFLRFRLRVVCAGVRMSCLGGKSHPWST